MATQVKRIEQEFLLTAAMREQASVIMSVGGGEWPVTISSVQKDGIRVMHSAPLSILRRGSLCDFHYNVRGQTIAFKAELREPGERSLFLSWPESLYKNLSRRYARLPPPSDLSASFSFAGERYDLDFPASKAYSALKEPVASDSFNPADIKGLVTEFEHKALEIGSERSIVLFKDKKPEGPVETLASDTGRAFFLPVAISGIPRNDPFVERSILTRDDFIMWFEESGLDHDYAEDETVRVERGLRSQGILSQLLVPILFQDYTVGYANIVNRQAGKPPFDLKSVETFMAFARVFAWSLHVHGYFKDAPRLDSDYKLQVVDVSAGGLLFACRDERLRNALKDGMEVSVRIKAKMRTVDASGIVRRHYAGLGDSFFGIQFSIMAPEDFRFLFEYLYGRPFQDEDSDSVEGIRITHP